MTQEQALQAVREMLPEIANGIRLERHHSIGKKFGNTDAFLIWDHNHSKCEILAVSQTSWEHVISMLTEKMLREQTPDTSFGEVEA